MGMKTSNGNGRGGVGGMTWISLGLGIAQLVAPAKMSRLIGFRDAPDTHSLVRLCGAREVAAGLGLLSGVQQDAWMGVRLGGDLVDVALLTSALTSRGTNRTRLLATTAMVLGATALDVIGAVRASRAARQPHSPTSGSRDTPTTHTVVVNRAPEDVYQFWLNFENFPRFMKNLESVTMSGNGRSHWAALGPGGKRFEWDAEIVENRPNELIRWRSTPGADVDNAGSVRFERAPGGRGTLVRVNLRYSPPAGALGSAVSMLFGAEPGQEVAEDLRRFKQVMETGEVVRSDASIHHSMHSARPPEGPVRLQDPFHLGGPTGRPSQTPSSTAARERQEVRGATDHDDSARAPSRTGNAGATLTRGGMR